MPRGPGYRIENMQLGNGCNIQPPQALALNVPKTAFAQFVFGFEKASDGGVGHRGLLANPHRLANSLALKTIYLAAHANWHQRQEIFPPFAT